MVGENGTRWIHSRTVSQAPDIAAADEQREQRTRARPRTQPASGVRSGMSPASKTTAFAGLAVRAARVVAGTTERVAAAVVARAAPLVSRLGGLVEAGRRSTQDVAAALAPAAEPAGRRATGCPSRTTSASTNAPTPEADRRAESRPEDGSRSRRSVPQRVGPQVDADAEQEDDPAMIAIDHDRWPIRRPIRAARLGPPSCGPPGPRRRRPRRPRWSTQGDRRFRRAVRRRRRSACSSSPASSSSSGVWSASAVPSDVSSVASSDSASWSSASSGVPSVRPGCPFPRSRRRGPARAPAPRAAELLHEIVEQVAHPSRESTRVVPITAGAALRPLAGSPASTVSASSFWLHAVAARAGSNRKAARIASGAAPGSRVDRRAGRPARGASGAARRPRGSARTARR